MALFPVASGCKPVRNSYRAKLIKLKGAIAMSRGAPVTGCRGSRWTWDRAGLLGQAYWPGILRFAANTSRGPRRCEFSGQLNYDGWRRARDRKDHREERKGNRDRRDDFGAAGFDRGSGRLRRHRFNPGSRLRGAVDSFGGRGEAVSRNRTLLKNGEVL